MPHDNVKACEDVFGKLQDNHMMSPTLIRINRTSPWSPCSAAIITDFLDSGHGKSKQHRLTVSRLSSRSLTYYVLGFINLIDICLSVVVYLGCKPLSIRL